VLLDGYQFDPKYQNQVKKTGHRLLVIDDTAHFSHYYADIVLNQGLGIDRLKYFHEPSTRLLLGSQYALLRSEFLIWRGWKREIPDVASKVLVTLGGSDRQNATLQVIKALKVVNRSDLQVKIVVGPSNPNIEILQDALYNSPCAMSILSSVSDMSKLMGWADLAITAAGSTCLELSFMQLPFAAIILAENQKYISEGVARAGIAISCGWYHELDTSSLASRINKLIEDRKSRSRMSKKASKIVDGFGADRAISAMEEYL
jgi:UDP-2,4-diacetamido-2,4,6-trideoxy-beta-L-altropyranose hydrolase